jgi:heterodisulfide reductase subunit A
MTDAGRHPKITLLTLSEVKEITGYVGNFKVKVLKKARFVDEKECTACGDCSKVCPEVTPNEFEIGLASRKAIYTPFPQAVPSAYMINPDECLGHDPVVCGKCLQACQKKCIDFDMKDQLLDFEVGTIVVATGMEVYDPTEMDEYGYSRYPNVITSMEFERLVNAGGPTQGEVIRPGDGKIPKSVAFIQCVGSRSRKKGKEYCSNICCMNTIKDTLLLKEHYPDIDLKVFYIDIRAFGKGFEDLYNRSREAGVQYLRGLPGDVQEDPETGDLFLTVENTSANRIESHRTEMVVLSTGVLPRTDDKPLQEMLALQRTSDGFYLEAHPKLLPVDSASRGVFFAGCCEGPKDVKESVTQASAAAARASRLMTHGKLKIEALTAQVNIEACTCCEICNKVCPYKAIKADRKTKTPAIVIEAACTGCGTCAAECPFEAIDMNHFRDGQIIGQLDAILEENPMEKIVTFACNWCSYAGADFAGVSRLQYPANARLIRTMCSGRVDEKFIWRAFRKGAPVVLVSGCHIGDCHYIDANVWTQKRVEKIWKRMERLGLRRERLQLEWVSAAEGVIWAKVMKRMEELRQQVTEEEVKQTVEILSKPYKGKSPPIPRLPKEAEAKAETTTKA